MTATASARPGAASPPRFAALAVPLWLLSLAIVAAAVALIAVTDSSKQAHLDVFLVTFLAIPVTFGTVDGVVAARRPESYAGWCLLGMALAFGLDLLLVV